MHVLLTGAGGFSGSVIARALVTAGHRVTALVGRSRGRLDDRFDWQDRLSVVAGPIRGEADLPRRIDAIIHAAARSPEPGVDRDAMIRDNVEATRTLLHYAAAAKASTFIFLSSISIYGQVSTKLLTEDAMPQSPDAYGATKLQAEGLVAGAASEFRAVSLRLPGVLGRNSVRNWMTSVLAKAAADDPIDIFNEDDGFNNALHVEDLAGFAVDLLSRKWTGHEAVNLAAAGRLSIRETVEFVIRQAGSRSAIRPLPGGKPSFMISSARAAKLFGYRPAEIKDVLQRFVADNKTSRGSPSA
jgi:nucleoside-diphosphate-sugar epimerase